MTCELQLNKAIIKDEHKHSLEREKEAIRVSIGITLRLLCMCNTQVMIWGSWQSPGFSQLPQTEVLHLGSNADQAWAHTPLPGGASLLGGFLQP